MPTCFIISPIGETGSEIRENADDLRDLIIRPALEIYQFEVIRGDHRSEAGQIDVDIIRAVQESDLCVVDVSLPNPNVYYEFGRRDETGKPIILLKAKNSEDLPVDVATRRYIEYDLDSRHGIRDAIQQLRNFVEPLVKRGFESTGTGASLSEIADTLKRVERKIDRMSEKGTVQPAIIPPTATTSDEDPAEVLRLALRQRNIPLAEQAMDQLKYRTPLHRWLDATVETVAAIGSVKAGDILIENIDVFMDDTASTLKEKVEYLGCLVSNLNRTDRELENVELVDRICASLLASAPSGSERLQVSIHNQRNRLYHGIYITTGEKKWLDKAIQSLQNALQISDSESFLYYNLAMCEQNRDNPGDMEMAREHIIHCIELDGEELDDDHLQKACEILHALGDPRLPDYLELLSKKSPIKAQNLIARLQKRGGN